MERHRKAGRVASRGGPANRGHKPVESPVFDAFFKESNAGPHSLDVTEVAMTFEFKRRPFEFKRLLATARLNLEPRGSSVVGLKGRVGRQGFLVRAWEERMPGRMQAGALECGYRGIGRRRPTRSESDWRDTGPGRRSRRGRDVRGGR
jgi:hypothetical protein